jgi:hypothetical protein
VFNSNFFTWGTGGLRYYDGATWTGVNVQRAIFDTASEGSEENVADTVAMGAISHTVTDEGDNNLLIIAVGVNDAVTHFANDAGLETKITATYGGTAMTVVSGSGAIETSSSNFGQVLFYMKSADITAGTAADIVVTPDTDAGGTVDITVLAASFIYVDQTTPFIALAAGNEAEGTAATAADLASVPATDSTELIVDFLFKEGTESGDSATANTLQTEIAQDDLATPTMHHCSSYQQGAAATVAMGWTWTNSRDFVYTALALNPKAETAITFLFENGEYLFAAPTGQRLLKSASGTSTWTPAGFNNKSNDYSWLEMHGGYIFGGKNSEAEVYFDTNSDLSALAGDPGDDADELVAGPGTTGTKSGISFLEKLAVARTDGLWTMDTDSATTTEWISKRTLNFKNLNAPVNFKTMATWGGSLYFTIQDKIIYEWNGAKLQNISPGYITDAWEYVTWYRFDNFTPFGDWLLMTARTTDTLSGHTGYAEAIIAWDGVGFHQLTVPITDGDGSITMMAIDTQNNYIWYHVSKTASETTYFHAFQSDSDFAFANYPTTGTHQITTSRIHAGFRRVDKSMPSLWLETDNCSATEKITVQYALDDSSTFRTWDTIVSDGEHVLYLPQNKLTEEFRYIRLRFVLETGSATATPVLEGFAMMVMMRPDFKMGYSFDIIGGTNVASGMFEDDRTGRSIMMDLRALRDRKEPIELVTPFGDHVFGYLTSLTEQAVEWEPEDHEGGDVNILQLLRCNFVETMAVDGTEDDVEPNW